MPTATAATPVTVISGTLDSRTRRRGRRRVIVGTLGSGGAIAAPGLAVVVVVIIGALAAFAATPGAVSGVGRRDGWRGDAGQKQENQGLYAWH